MSGNKKNNVLSDSHSRGDAIGRGNYRDDREKNKNHNNRGVCLEHKTHAGELRGLFRALKV